MSVLAAGSVALLAACGIFAIFMAIIWSVFADPNDWRSTRAQERLATAGGTIAFGGMFLLVFVGAVMAILRAMA